GLRPEGAVPVDGFVDATYNRREETLSLGTSRISTPATKVQVSGVLGAQIQVTASTTDLNDLLPAINIFSNTLVSELPVSLRNGSAGFQGTVTGKLNAPEIAGHVEAASFLLSGAHMDKLSAEIAVNESGLQVRNASVLVGTAQVQTSSVSLALTNWKPHPDGAIAGAVNLRGADIASLLALAGRKEIPVSGALSATAKIAGTYGNPLGSASVTVTKGVAYDEPFDSLQAQIESGPRTLALRDVRLALGGAQITGSATYEHPAGRLDSGRVQFQVASTDMALQRIESLKKLRAGLAGTVRARAEGSATVLNTASGAPQLLLSSLSGQVAARNLQLQGKPAGNFNLQAQSNGTLLNVQLRSDFLDATTQGNGQWRLQPGYPGEAHLQFSKISLATVRNWLSKDGKEAGTPALNGSAEGKLSLSGPAFDFRSWKGTLEIAKLELAPVAPVGSANVPRIALRNEMPVVLTLDRSVVRIASAKLSGTDTDLEVTGSIALQEKVAMDVRVNGSLNLAILQAFDSDLASTGKLQISTTVRGAPDQPQVSGRAEFKNASLSLVDFPNGLSNITGNLLFNGTRATVESFSAESGGGRISASGFVGYNGELSYRLQAKAAGVRVRYPEGVSTTANADIVLNGTSARSLLQGTVTILRTGFNPRTDLSSILSKSAEPVRTPAVRTGPLSNMQLDVKIETAPDISFESALAQDIQAEASMRLQGTIYNPALLGRVSVTQGEITFFGTKYIISQGTISFLNPVKVEPVLDLDLETRVRGIDVTLTFTGPLNKLTITHRSDPPLEFSEIVALLATGAPPTSDP
ncbi:MAG: translocation/assembly module TamB domain-containing protein, partial [Bryobacteraceae bacterium]